MVYYKLNQAFCTLIIKHIQHCVFREEIENIKRTRPVSKWLRKLTPFIDDECVLSVGTRLIYSKLSYNCRHSAILPRKDRLTHLIIKKPIKSTIILDSKLCIFLLFHNYLILSPKRAVRSVVSSCLKCFKLNPKFSPPIMESLPLSRVSHVPFSHVGIDFRGLFLIIFAKTRASRSQMAYICVFVCLSVRTIYLELYSELSAQAFLVDSCRFMSRRDRIACSYRAVPRIFMVPIDNSLKTCARPLQKKP